MVHLRRQIISNALVALVASSYGPAFALASFASQTKGVVNRPVGQQRPVFLQQTQSQLFSTPAGEISNTPNNDDSININKSLITKLLGAAALTILITQRQLLSQLSLTALRAYESSLVTYPRRTKVITGASLAVMGDYLAQAKDMNNSEVKKDYDVPRAVSFAAFDSCYRMFQHVAIPAIVMLGQGKAFHAILSKIPFVKPTIAFTAAMERTFIYQFALIPFFYYPIFFTFTGLMQGLTIKETIQRAKQSFFPCMKRNLLFWIPVQMIMFGLIVERWQIPFACVMGIVWSLILSATAGAAGKKSS